MRLHGSLPNTSASATALAPAGANGARHRSPRRPARLQVGLGLALTSWLAFAPVVAHAKEPALARGELNQCIAAGEQVQELRRQGKLQKARDAVAGCMNPKCPAMIRTDCDDYSRKIEAALPSVIVRVTADGGNDVPSASVTVDGAPVALDGRPIELDPGTHAIASTARGYETATAEIVVQEGVKNRTVLLELKAIAAPVVVMAPPKELGKSKQPTTGTWVATGVLGATAVAGLAVFAGMGLSGNGRYDDLKEQCAGRCASADVDKLRTRYLVADVGLVVGVAAAVAAGAVLALGPRKARSAEPGPAPHTARFQRLPSEAQSPLRPDFRPARAPAF